jgi:hypothetical protein
MPGAWETEAEWRRLKRELDAWRERRMHADVLGQHRSQLDAAFTLVDRALAEVRVSIAGTPGSAAGAASWRVQDRRLAWLRRLWEFFRERFDQREDPSLGAVLRGADEVVWSCHREPFATLESVSAGAGGAPPLPYVEAALTPEVFPHGLVPGSLRRDVDAPFLTRALERLPFAVVRVPASCVTAPWWLVHLGHEVGHVVDSMLLGYPSRAAVVASLGLDARATDDWTQWSGETFADLYAVLMHGQWALWALATAEREDEAGLTARRDSYPPPVVRLLVMTHVCTQVGASTADVQSQITTWQEIVDRHPELAAALEGGRRVVDALLTHDVQRIGWPVLAAWDAPRWARQALGAWTARLVKRPEALAARPRREWPREIVAASVLRRKDAERTPAGLEETSIGHDLLGWLPVVREGGSRSGRDDVKPRVAAQAVALARDLMDAEPLP